MRSRSGRRSSARTREERDRLWPIFRARGESVAFAVLPLHGRTGVLGALNLGFAEEHDFDPEERSFLQAFASSTSPPATRRRSPTAAPRSSSRPRRRPRSSGVDAARRDRRLRPGRRARPVAAHPAVAGHQARAREGRQVGRRRRPVRAQRGVRRRRPRVDGRPRHHRRHRQRQRWRHRARPSGRHVRQPRGAHDAATSCAAAAAASAQPPCAAAAARATPSCSRSDQRASDHPGHVAHAGRERVRKNLRKSRFAGLRPTRPGKRAYSCIATSSGSCYDADDSCNVTAIHGPGLVPPPAGLGPVEPDVPHRAGRIRPSARLTRLRSGRHIEFRARERQLPGLSVRVDVPAAFEGTAERELVGVLEVAAHRQPARDPGDPHAERLEQPAEVQRGGLALDVRVRAEDDLLRRPSARGERAAPSPAADPARRPRSG